MASITRIAIPWRLQFIKSLSNDDFQLTCTWFKVVGVLVELCERFDKLLIELPDIPLSSFSDGVTFPSLVGSEATLGGRGKEPSTRIGFLKGVLLLSVAGEVPERSLIEEAVGGILAVLGVFAFPRSFRTLITGGIYARTYQHYNCDDVSVR